MSALPADVEVDAEYHARRSRGYSFPLHALKVRHVCDAGVLWRFHSLPRWALYCLDLWQPLVRSFFTELLIRLALKSFAQRGDVVSRKEQH
jgi:hypothetical protein